MKDLSAGNAKRLKEFPAIPSTPPPSDKKDRGLQILETELEHERLDTLHKDNKEIEKILQGFDRELSYAKNSFPQNLVGDGKVHADNELWLKYESQIEVNKKLEKERKHLEFEVRQIEEQGVINLDSLTQSELILYVKKLDRTRTDLKSELRATEWSMDKQAKDIHHLEELRKFLEADIRHYDEELVMFRHYKKTSCPSASITTSRVSLYGDGKSTDRKKATQKGKGDKSERGDRKRNSLSAEDVTDVEGNEVMFSSLDETKLRGLTAGSPTAGFNRRTAKGGIPDNKRVIDAKKGPIKKTAAVGSLPELRKPKSEKERRSKAEKTTKVGRDSTPRPRSATLDTAIRIVVTDEGDPKGEVTSVLTKPDPKTLVRSGMMFGSAKSFENSPPPKAEGFTFDEEAVKSLSGIAEVDEEDVVEDGRWERNKERWI